MGPKELVLVNSVFPVIPLTNPGSRVSHLTSGVSAVDNEDADFIGWLQVGTRCYLFIHLGIYSFLLPFN